MDNILGRRLEYHDSFNSNWECLLCGVDGGGHVIQYESLAKINSTALQELVAGGSVPLDELVRQRAQVYEAVDEFKRVMCAKRARAAGADASGEGGGGQYNGRRFKSVYLLNLSGFTYSMLTKKIRDILKAIFAVGSDMFPEAMATM